MKYLLDTNIVSELMKPEPDASVVAWLNRNDEDTALSALALAELASGVETLDEGKHKADLSRELRFLQEDYGDSILPFDGSAAWEWARFVKETQAAGLTPPLMDSLIAATARAWGLKVVTRNASDFPLVETVNAFAET